MKKDKCSVVFRAVRNFRGGNPIRCLVFLAAVAFSAGCASNQVKDYTPKSAMVCDEVRITGTLHRVGDLEGVWFNGVPAKAYFRHFPAPKGPLEILAVVPEGASNGPIRVKITAEGDALFEGKGVDYTFGQAFSVTGSPPVPAINSFSANPATIKPGQTSTLSWQVSPAATQLTLDGVDVSGTNSQTVSPVTTTFYNLVAKNESCLQRSQILELSVLPGPQAATNGAGLAQANEPSPAVLTPGATTGASTVANPSNNQPTAPMPAAVAGASAKAPVVAGSDSRHTNPPALARQNGPFVDIKSKIGFASQTSGSRELQVSTNVTGWPLPALAVFQQGGAILARHNFQPGIIGGAAFSPGGDQAVSVTADPNGFSASYVEVIERFATHYQFQFPVNIMEGYKTATNRWHVLFSPDDTLVMVSSVPVGSPAKIAIQVHDLVRQKNVGALIQGNCTACDPQGEVINGNTVKITLDGAVVGTFPIN